MDSRAELVRSFLRTSLISSGPIWVNWVSEGGGSTVSFVGRLLKGSNEHLIRIEVNSPEIEARLRPQANINPSGADVKDIKFDAGMLELEFTSGALLRLLPPGKSASSATQG